MDGVFFEGLTEAELSAILNVLWYLYDDDLYSRFHDLLEIVEEVGRIRGIVDLI